MCIYGLFEQPFNSAAMSQLRIRGYQYSSA